MNIRKIILSTIIFVGSLLVNNPVDAMERTKKRKIDLVELSEPSSAKLSKTTTLSEDKIVLTSDVKEALDDDKKVAAELIDSTVIDIEKLDAKSNAFVVPDKKMLQDIEQGCEDLQKWCLDLGCKFTKPGLCLIYSVETF